MGSEFHYEEAISRRTSKRDQKARKGTKAMKEMAMQRSEITDDSEEWRTGS
jgi:hypothetical protein